MDLVQLRPGAVDSDDVSTAAIRGLMEEGERLFERCRRSGQSVTATGTLKMNDLSSSQDSCKNANLTLNFTS